jgi:hypothetical protein
VAAQALADRRLSPGLIADMHHVAPVVVKLAFEAAGDRIVLVSDAASAAGMPPGRYELGGEPIELPAEGPPVRADGTLAGSALRLDAAIANVVRLGIDPVTAINAATRPRICWVARISAGSPWARPPTWSGSAATTRPRGPGSRERSSLLSGRYEDRSVARSR